MSNIFKVIMDQCVKGLKLYETFNKETKRILEDHQITENVPCHQCKGAKKFLHSGHPAEPAEWLNCGKCDGTGIEFSFDMLDIHNRKVLTAIFKEPNGREWFLNGCIK